MDLSDELAFVSRPAEVHRNRAVDLRFLRDGSLVVVGSSGIARLTGTRDALDGLVEVWSTLDASTSRSVSDQLGMSELDADHALGILWQAGALSAAALGATPAERFWLARDPAGDGRSPVCRVIVDDAAVREVATDCLERSGFTVGTDDADVALWLGGEIEEPDGPIPVLLASAHESSARIGPVFDDSPMSPCFTCFRAIAEDLGAAPKEASTRLWRVAVGLAVQRLTSLVLHYQAGHVKNMVTEVSLAHGTRSVHATADPDCPRCLERLGCAGTGTDDAVISYELSTYGLGTEAADVSPGGEPLPRYRPALGYRQEAVDSVPPDTPLHGARLVARAATGVNPAEPHRRLTPSGGDLRTSDAFYLVAGGTGGDVTVGLCPQDTADEVHEREVACPESSIKGLLDGADAAIVVVADLRRNARKYGSFGVKLALLETGCALANAAASAAALGWRTEAREGVHASDELREVLGLTSPHEFVTCVARLCRDRGHRKVEA